jgi:hypothetical protein
VGHREIAPSEIARQCITGIGEIQFLERTVASLSSEKKAEPFLALLLNGGLVLKSFSKRAKS